MSVDAGLPAQRCAARPRRAGDRGASCATTTGRGAVVAGAQALEVEATGVVGPNEPTDRPAHDAGRVGHRLDPPGRDRRCRGRRGRACSSTRASASATRTGPVTANPEGMTQEELDRRAGTLLVQLDDSLKSSEQELGFAVAQFGETATADFTAVLASAKQKVQQAFELQQQLEDVDPETAEQKRAMTTQIIQLCESADAELDAQADAFDELRQLEKNAPQELAEVRAEAAKMAERKDAAAAALAALVSTYADSAVKPVAGNIEQAREAADVRRGGGEEGGRRARRRQDAAKPRSRCARRRRASARSGSSSTRSTTLAHEPRARRRPSSMPRSPTPSPTSPQRRPCRRMRNRRPSHRPSLPPRPRCSRRPRRRATRSRPSRLVATANASLDQVFGSVRDEQERITACQVPARDHDQRGAFARSRPPPSTSPPAGAGSATPPAPGSAKPTGTSPRRSPSPRPIRSPRSPRRRPRSSSATTRSRSRGVTSTRSRTQSSYDNSVVSGGGDGADLGGLLGDLIFGGGGYRGGRLVRRLVERKQRRRLRWWRRRQQLPRRRARPAPEGSAEARAVPAAVVAARSRGGRF